MDQEWTWTGSGPELDNMKELNVIFNPRFRGFNLILSGTRKASK